MQQTAIVPVQWVWKGRVSAGGARYGSIFSVTAGCPAGTANLSSGMPLGTTARTWRCTASRGLIPGGSWRAASVALG